MRILHIDDTFHPSYGYQCNPLAKFQKKEGHDVCVIAPDKTHIYPLYKQSFNDDGSNLEIEDLIYENNTGVKIYRVNARGYIAGRLVYKKELFSTIDRIKPDIIMMHCLETITAIRVMMRYQKKYPIVFDSHMLSMASKNRFVKTYEYFFRKIITPVIISNDFTIIKVQNDDYVTSHLGIPEKQTRYISFGTDTDLFKESLIQKKKFLKDNKFASNAFVIVSTGKLTEAKNGKLLAEAVKKRFNTTRQVVIVVVAEFIGEYEKEVRTILSKSENTVLFYPCQKYNNLPFFYQIADVVVFPKQCSMSFFDAQSCEAVVLSENNKINIERNSHNNGMCFTSGSIIDFRKKIELLINMDYKKFLKMKKDSRIFIEANYSYKKIAVSFLNILIETYKKFYKIEED